MSGAAKKKLIIDGQIFQTEAKDRGMGRYSACLMEALAKNQGHYQAVEVILTENLPVPAQLSQQLKDMLNGAEVRVLDLQTTKKHKIEEAFSHNQTVLTGYVKTQTEKGYTVDYLMPSLFQEPVAAVFPDYARKFLIFYDLVPFLYHRRYRPVMNFDNYLKRFRYIFEADRIFTISQTTADDLHVHVGVPKSKLVRIDGAAIRPGKPPSAPAFALPEKFILMPTSDDPRKNNLRAVLGFEEFLHEAGAEGYKLVITSKIHKREREYLQLFSKSLVFTGNLPEEQLDWLYKQCELVLFVPEYEGLGLPVLEAVEFNKNVVCSSIGIFKEISEETFCYCDHEDSSSIASALTAALKHQPDRAAYKKISGYYSWPKTAERLVASMAGYEPAALSARGRIAVFSPNLDSRSAAAKVVARSHAALSARFAVDYYVEKLEKTIPKDAARPDFLRFAAQVRSAETFGAKTYGSYDAVVYHLEDGDGSLQALQKALYLPGYAVLYGTALQESYKLLAENGLIPPQRLEIEERLDAIARDNGARYLTTLANTQLGVLAPSRYVQSAVKKIAPSLSVDGANLPSPVADLPAFKQTGNVTVGLAGVKATKEELEFIEGMANDPAFNHCYFLVLDIADCPKDTLDRLNSYENVSASTNLTDFEFETGLSKLDVFAHYCLNYNGETSLVTIEALCRGLPVIVRDIGWYGELPDGAAIKAGSKTEFFEKLRAATQDKSSLRTAGEHAKKYAAENFGNGQYVAVLTKLIGQKPAPANANYKIAEALKAGRIKSAHEYAKFLKGNV